MPQVKVTKAVTQVAISLTAEEAGKLMNVLDCNVDFGEEQWARELHSALETQEIESVGYVSL
jgi:hypothetical protein